MCTVYSTHCTDGDKSEETKTPKSRHEINTGRMQPLILTGLHMVLLPICIAKHLLIDMGTIYQVSSRIFSVIAKRSQRSGLVETHFAYSKFMTCIDIDKQQKITSRYASNRKYNAAVTVELEPDLDDQLASFSALTLLVGSSVL